MKTIRHKSNLLVCKICEDKFYVRPSRRKKAKYCSINCRRKGTKTGNHIECDFCGEKHWKYRFALIQNKTNFCSVSCRDKYQKEHQHFNWKGGVYTFSNGYIGIRQPDGRYKLEHRIIMEKHLNRRLGKHELVHHLNGIRTDNRIENLTLTDAKNHEHQTYIKQLQKRIRYFEKLLGVN